MKVVKQNHAVPAQDYDGATGIESVADTRVTAGMTTDGTALAGAEDEPRCFPQYSDITYVHKNPILGLHRILGNNVRAPGSLRVPPQNSVCRQTFERALRSGLRPMPCLSGGGPRCWCEP